MTDRADNPRRVLVTGATGAVGEPVCRYLLERGHYVRGFARRPSPGLEDYVRGDLSDADAVHRAAEGMDVIVHLGAYPNPADFTDVLIGPNVIGAHNICEAAREQGIKRLVLASSMQVLNGYGWPRRTIKVEDGPRPDNDYALTKVWAEAMGDMYARCHGLSVISVRIGWLPRNPREADFLDKHDIGPDCYLSHRDACRFHALCVESPDPPPGESVILFATSRPAATARMDLEPARDVIGYEPQDTWPEGLGFAWSRSR